MLKLPFLIAIIRSLNLHYLDILKGLWELTKGKQSKILKNNKKNISKSRNKNGQDLKNKHLTLDNSAMRLSSCGSKLLDGTFDTRKVKYHC
jgi:hypothetical protein